MKLIRLYKIHNYRGWLETWAMYPPEGEIATAYDVVLPDGFDYGPSKAGLDEFWSDKDYYCKLVTDRTKTNARPCLVWTEPDKNFPDGKPCKRYLAIHKRVDV